MTSFKTNHFPAAMTSWLTFHQCNHAATGHSLRHLKQRTWSINPHFEDCYYTNPLASSLCSSCSFLFPEPLPLVTGHRHSIKQVPIAGHQYPNENTSLPLFLPEWSRPKYFTEWTVTSLIPAVPFSVMKITFFSITVSIAEGAQGIVGFYCYTCISKDLIKFEGVVW